MGGQIGFTGDGFGGDQPYPNHSPGPLSITLGLLVLLQLYYCHRSKKPHIKAGTLLGIRGNKRARILGDLQLPPNMCWI